MTADRLRALDASFLWFEGPGRPVHIGAVGTFEAGPLIDGQGRLRLADLRDRLAARLTSLPRLRRRLAPVPLDLERPAWVDDPDFDITRHVSEMRLPPPGDDARLVRLVGELQGETLPRDRPLWDIVFVTGLSGDRVALVERIHHALVDGVSGVDAAALMLDLGPDEPPPPPPEGWSPPPPPGPAGSLAESLRRRLGDPARLAGGLADLVRHPTRATRALTTVAEGIGAVAGDGLLAPRTSLNAPLTGGRRLAWLRVGLDEVQAAGHDAGATVNDVLLAAVAGGLRWLLLERGEPVPIDLAVKAVVPVSLRTEDEHGNLGNRVGAMIAPLPVGIGDPQVRFDTVVRTMARLKAQPQAEATGLLLDAADALPAGAAHLVTLAVTRQPLANLVVTNVPGPPAPLYLAGARLLEAFPVLPLGANLTVGVAILSYGDRLTLGLTADDQACPDVDVLADGIARSLDAMGVAAGRVGAGAATAGDPAP